MKQWPDFDSNGDSPVGIHQASLVEVVERFGTSTIQREVVARRLVRIYKLARSTGQLARFAIFGSFVTVKPEPNDVDIFMLMEDTFDSVRVTGEASVIFDHPAAQNYEGASVFWIRRMAAIGGEQAALEHWQISRATRQDGALLRSSTMIKSDQEFEATLERIRYFQEQVERLRQTETNPMNYRLSAGGYLAEIDRMNLEVREYLWLHPSELIGEIAPAQTS